MAEGSIKDYGSKTDDLEKHQLQTCIIAKPFATTHRQKRKSNTTEYLLKNPFVVFVTFHCKSGCEPNLL